MNTSEATLLATIIQGGSTGVGGQLLSESEELGVTPECFTSNICQDVWEIINKIDRSGRQIDEQDVLTDIQITGKSAADFMALMDHAKTSLHLSTYATKVLEQYKLRMLNRMSREVQEKTANGEEASEIMIGIDQTTKKLSETGAKQKPISEAIDSFVADFFGDFDKTAYVPTGIKAYDSSLNRGGFGPSQLCVFAARPGCGKSAMALNIVHRAAKKGLPIGMFSLEMGSEELMGRMVSMESGVDWERARDGVASKSQNDDIKKAIAAVKKWPIQLCDDAFNLPLILSIARNWKRKHDVKAIIIDYCQLIRANPKLPREQQVAEISRECKLLAKSLKVPVILLAQINRESEKENREPRMSDLRESGALEQDADSITFLFQKSDDDKTGPMVRWVRPKQRGGTGYDAGKLGFIRQTGAMIDFQG